MSRNVQCAGGGDTITLPVKRYGDPCGWEGERVKILAGFIGFPNPSFWKPCPRCGGRVTEIRRDEEAAQ